MTSTDTLLPCPVPWCGSDVLEAVRSPWSRGYCITCQSCGVQSPSRETEAEATAAWNRRTTPTPAAEEREAVARAIKGVLFRIWGALYGDAASRLADAALSALAPIRAAEILAAEARGREVEAAAIMDWLCDTYDPDDEHDERLDIAQAIEVVRHIKHGAGK